MKGHKIKVRVQSEAEALGSLLEVPAEFNDIVNIESLDLNAFTDDPED